MGERVIGRRGGGEDDCCSGEERGRKEVWGKGYGRRGVHCPTLLLKWVTGWL